MLYKTHARASVILWIDKRAMTALSERLSSWTQCTNLALQTLLLSEQPMPQFRPGIHFQLTEHATFDSA